MKAMIKSLLLTFLILLSIYQTAMLWFDYPSDRNFFYNIIGSGVSAKQNVSKLDYDLLFPKELAYFSGSSPYLYARCNLSKSDNLNLLESTLQLIEIAFEEGSLEAEEMNLSQIWQEQHLMMILPNAYTGERLLKDFMFKKSWILEEMEFFYIYIIPAQLGDEGLRIVFVNEEFSQSYSCLIETENIKLINDKLISDMSRLEREKNEMYFSAKFEGIPLFPSEVLLPSTDQSFNFLKTLYGKLAFYEDGEREEKAFYEFSDYFFVNPEDSWSMENEKEIRRGNIQALVRYDAEGFFEYSLIEEIEEKTVSVSDAYQIAEAFLSKDRLLSGIEYYFEDYEILSDGIVFRYRYSYRDIPIHFGNVSQYSMKTPMEIKIRGSRVMNYKRLLWSGQDLLTQESPFRLRFQEPVDRWLEKQEHGNVAIDNLMICYQIEKGSVNAKLGWTIDSERERYFIELE
ncbi:MAG: hypothetical protein JW708_02815 [Vallitaleaceae bacterium]|nr:hypothetical protein [Vallitaleaceae bacterium]